MEGYGRPGDPWDRGNPPSWDREAFQRDWFDRERGVQPNTWEGQAGAPVETWDKRGVPRDVEFASAADQPWERGRMVELDQGAGQWDREERPLAREAPRREDRFDERERHGGRDPYYERERGNDRERPREADLGRSRRSHSSERSRGRSRDRDSRREYRRRSRSRSRSRSRERRRERDEERRRRNTAEPEPSTIIMMRNLRSSVTEDDISKVLGDKHSLLREVRLIRDRGGTSKGFAFLEFFRIEDARTWLESNKNDFFLQGGQVSLEYSRQRFHDRDRHGRDDWTCFKCNTRNFRNIYCSTCECSRHESESLSDERGRDPAKSLERESNPPSQNDGAAFAFQRVAPPYVSNAAPSGLVPNIGLPSVPVDLVQRIRSGSFVDASELLPELFEVASYEGEMREGDRNLYSVNSPIDWAVCFATYGALLCAMNPSKAHDLFAYMGIVLQIARSLPGDEWLQYDRAFRQMAVVNPTLPWSELDYHLWLSIAQPSDGMRDGEGAHGPTEPNLRARSPTPPPLMAISAGDHAFSASHSSPQVNPNSTWLSPLPQSGTEREGSSRLASQEWNYPRAASKGENSFREASARPSLAEKQFCHRWNETRCDVLGCPLVHLCSVCRSRHHRGRDCPERLPERHEMMAPASSIDQNRSLQVCRNWNAEKCFFRDCKFLHACIHCKSVDHRGPDCPTIVEPVASAAKFQDICKNWNAGRCFFKDCNFLHACIHCKSTDHRGPDCPTIVEPVASAAKFQDICKNWNAGRCSFKDCNFLHACIHCKSTDHRGPDCPTIVEPAASAAKLHDACKNWNTGKCFFTECRFLHACIHCKSADHRGPDCPTIVAPAASAAKTHNICRNWNAEKCFFKDCKFLHACIHCKSADHRGPDCCTIVEPAVSPTKIQDICRNWNSGKCFFTECRFLHACIHCKSADHRGGDCPTTVEPAVSAAKIQDVCRNWNAGKCFFKDCRFRHACSHCKSADHRGPDCPTIVEPAVSPAKIQDICRNWNAGKCFFKDCKFLHACSHCKSIDHIGPDCPKNQSTSSAPGRDAPSRSAPGGDALTRDTPTSGSQAACRMWNNGWCFLKGCRYLHVCSRCRSTAHKAPNCLVQQDDNNGDGNREICMKWNADNCALSRCMYLHACSVCRSTMHTSRNCRTVTVAVSESRESAKDSEVCRKWNFKSCIGGPDCRKLHVCLLCKTPDHNALSCPRLGEGKSGPAPSDGQLSQVVCRNWNYKHCFLSDCQYKHVCMLCMSPAHPASLCSSLGEGDESEGSRDTNVQCCRDWNNSRCIFKGCRFRHACFRCHSLAHKVVNCPYAQ